MGGTRSRPVPLARLLAEVRGCRVCAADLPEGPRPVVQLGAGAPIVIIGQAPGRRVHASGVPWDDPSGERLRAWLGVAPSVFYDPERIAIVPMGLCYPGRGASGDRPPRPECAPLWHDRLLAHLPPDRFTILVGDHARRRYAPDATDRAEPAAPTRPHARAGTLTAAVASWESLLPDRVVLPHPSPRNRHWLARHPWFERDVVPAVQARVRAVLDPRPPPQTRR